MLGLTRSANGKENLEKEMNVKLYEQILKKKKDVFMQTRREDLISRQESPKAFLEGIQPRKKQIENNLIVNQWFDYARQLYEKE